MPCTHHESIQLFLYANQPVITAGLKQVLKTHKKPPIEIIGETGTISEVPALINYYPAHITMMCLAADEINAFHENCGGLKNKHTSVIVLSEFKDHLTIQSMLYLDVKGLLLLNSEPGEILEAVKVVYTGERYYCAHTTKMLVDSLVHTKTGKEETVFTATEIKIIELICCQHTRTEMAEIVGISTRAIDEYRKKIQIKTNTRNDVGIALYAVKNKMVML